MRGALERPTAAARLGGPAVVAGLTLGATACSSASPYAADLACSIDATAVAGLMGSDRFVAEDEQLAGTPLDASAPGRTSCVVDHDDRRLVVEARVVDAVTAATNESVARAEETLFEYRGGWAARATTPSSGAAGR